MFSRRLVHRITGLFVRWGLLKHPYGREYARQRYTLTGRRRPELETGRRTGARGGGVPSRTRAALVATALLLLSLAAAGVLFAAGG
jgi:hypothetical protein